MILAVAEVDPPFLSVRSNIGILTTRNSAAKPKRNEINPIKIELPCGGLIFFKCTFLLPFYRCLSFLVEMCVLLMLKYLNASTTSSDAALYSNTIGNSK